MGCGVGGLLVFIPGAFAILGPPVSLYFGLNL